MFSVQKARYNN